jgi:tetratricopeptide (TPR) repeat protein
MRQGNYAKARELWMKGLKKATDPNEYLYQSLGLLAQEMGRIEEARKWFRRGTENLNGIRAHAIWQVCRYPNLPPTLHQPTTT